MCLYKYSKELKNDFEYQEKNTWLKSEKYTRMSDEKVKNLAY